MSSSLEPLKQRVDQFPDNELFRFSYAKALMDQGNFKEALPHLEFCFQKKSDWMVVAMLMGKIHRHEGHLSEAREIYQKALHLAVTQKHESPEAEIREILGSLDL